MAASHDQAGSASDQDYRVVVNVWGGDIGHASLSVSSKKGNNYLSFWPSETGPRSIPRPSQLQSYAEDCSAEGINEGDSKEPDGIYMLPLSKEQANAMHESIETIRRQVSDGTLKYMIANQYPQSRAQHNENYNCSGMVEKVINQNLGIEFGSAVESTPLRVAEIMQRTVGVTIQKHDVIVLGPPIEDPHPRAHL